MTINTLDRPYADQTLCRSVTDISGTDCGAVYDQTERHRFLLWRVWVPTAPFLVCIGLNPSTATELELDPTLRRDLRYAREWGFGGIVKLNLFSFRSTDPKALSGPPAWGDIVTGGFVNDTYIQHYTGIAGATLCAWGMHGAMYGRGHDVRDTLWKYDLELWAMGFCKNGEPKHTLYLPANQIAEPWSA